MPLGKLVELDRKAKDALREGAEPARRNVFISFAHEDLNEVNLLRGQAKSEYSDLEFNDYSLREPFDSEKAEYIKNGIRERIRQSSVTVVYVSDVTHQSQWVNWEIRESVRLGKGIVAVHKGAAPPSVLPAALAEHSVRPIPWTQAGLAAAIATAATTRES